MNPGLDRPDRRRIAFEELDRSPKRLARALIGMRLVTEVDGERTGGVIVETEAYVGAKDRAAHSYGGRRTNRTEVMFHRAGIVYVYLIYGMHHCVNVVASPEGEGTAVLVRALEPTDGLDVMRRRRSVRANPGPDHRLCAGPGRLAEALGIDRSMNGDDLGSSDRIRLERGPGLAAGPRAGARRIVRGPRIGVDSAGAWATRPLRYAIEGHRSVSVAIR